MPAERETLQFDVLIVGGGPAGLAAGIHIRQLAMRQEREISVCLIEKGAELGAHTLSGAVMDPRALDELFPDWQERGAPLTTPVSEDMVLLLSAQGARRLPNSLVPGSFLNRGNHVVRLGHLVRWLGEQAEGLGVDVYPGFAGAEVLYDEAGSVRGVATGDMGVERNGEPGPNFTPGIELEARYTLFAEGCRGHLGRQLEQRFGLRNTADPQTFGIGLKELWEVPTAQHRPGLVVHSAGWPMDDATYGGGFVYHLDGGLVAVGLVVGLDYTNPYLSPFDEFQRYKTHPAIRKYLDGGKRLAFGARAIATGGLQSQPRLALPGGVLIGDDAGFVNAARIKGSHAAIKSGMLAAEAVCDALAEGRSRDELSAYPQRFRDSWLFEELHRTRNFKPYMKHGLRLGATLFAVEQFLTRGRVPWTLHNQADHDRLRPAAESVRIDYPRPDGQLTFDRPSSVYLSNTNHVEDQPCHIVLKDPAVPITVNLARYDLPEQRYCPAAVFELVRDADDPHPRLQVNAQNCVHCKTCDIKDPGQNIIWKTPQGGDGPIYQGM